MSITEWIKSIIRRDPKYAWCPFCGRYTEIPKGAQVLDEVKCGYPVEGNSCGRVLFV